MRIQCDDSRQPEYELFKAVQDANLKEVRRLVREGASPNLLLKRKGGLSPFHLSVGLSSHKALDIVAVLLDGQGNPNNRSYDGMTPLHIAAMWGHLQAVELLVNSDADIELCDNEGKTALMLAQENGQYHVSRYLDKLQRHIITAVCEAEEACSRMDQARHNQAAGGRPGSNILSQSEESDNNSVKNTNIKLNIQPQNCSNKTDAYTQFPDGGHDSDTNKLRWSTWVKQIQETTAGAKRSLNLQNLQHCSTPDTAGYSAPLAACLRGQPMRNVLYKEDSISASFSNNTHSFNYLLLDPRYTKNLPCRASKLPLQECFRVFCNSVFHVGRGKRTRPLAHLQDATSRSKDNSKIRRVRNIWNAGYGVISVQVGGGMSCEEALTRQALVVAAVGLHNLCNVRGGNLYPPCNAWSYELTAEVGVIILFRAMLSYLSAGEKLWFKHDLI